MNPLYHTDSYKHTHGLMFFPKTTQVYSHCTPRSNHYLKKLFPTIDDKYIVFGTQYVLKKMLEQWDKYFFNVSLEEALEPIESFLKPHFIWTEEVTNQVKQKFNELYKLGSLPIIFKSLPEGCRVDINTPIFTITNSHKDFAWLPNFLESYLLSEIYMPVTVATICDFIHKNTLKYYDKCSDISPDFAQHCFSYRGHQNTDVSAVVGMAYALFNKGSDTIASFPLMKKYYNQKTCNIFSISATEHSISTLNINYFLNFLKDFKYKTYETVTSNLIEVGLKDQYLQNALEVLENKDNLPDTEVAELLGILRIMALTPSPLAYVADSLDFWAVIKNLKYIKQSILSRPETAPFIIRPDSGDPVKVVLGDSSKPEGTEEHKGLIQSLIDLFGYTVNSKGYKVLAPQIRAVYGDGLNYQRMNDIYSGLDNRKISPENICLALGAYILGNVTRDSLGFALKASYVNVNDIQINVSKEPKTDMSKKSFRGRIAVVFDNKLNKYNTIQDVSEFYEETYSLLAVQDEITFNSIATILKHT